MSSIQVQGSSSGAGTITVVAPITANSRTLILPDQNGTLLSSAGAISVNAATPAGSLVFDAGGNIFVGGISTFTNVIRAVSTVNALSTTTGALTVAGGVGIGGNIFVGGISTFTNAIRAVSTINASSTTTGALTVAGGVGIGKDLVVGGNLKLTTASAVVQNSAGNPILRQSGSILKVEQFNDPGSSTTSGSLVNLNNSAFFYTPVSTNSTLYLTISAYAYNYPLGGYAAGGCVSFYVIGEYISNVWTPISNTGYLWSSQYSSTYAQSIATQAYMTCTRSNSSLTVRQFDLMGAVTNLNMPFYGNNIIFTVMEVAN